MIYVPKQKQHDMLGCKFNMVEKRYPVIVIYIYIYVYNTISPIYIK